MIRKKNKYRRPLKPFEATRIKEENELRKKYGLKNKTEIWKTTAKVDYFRSRAKELAKRPVEEQNVLFGKLRAIGLKVDSISDVLDLKVENLLERRLTTVLVKKNLANTPKQARQLVTHKKVKINGKVMSAPGYLVPVADEDKMEIKVKTRAPKPVVEDKSEEAGGEESVEDSGEETEVSEGEEE